MDNYKAEEERWKIQREKDKAFFSQNRKIKHYKKVSLAELQALAKKYRSRGS